LLTLNLEGHGIRGMSYVPSLAGYLVISGPVSKERSHFRLWFWTGKQGDSPRHVVVPGLPGFEHAEGIAPALIDGKPMIVIVSDDGNREEGHPAKFLMLPTELLQISP